MKLKKRIILSLSFLCAASLFAVIGSVGGRLYKSTSAKEDDIKTVIIDSGHGGYDGGAVAEDGTVEKNINLMIALKLKDIFEFNGYRVVMTRTEDVDTDDSDSDKYSKKDDLENRLALMKKYPDSIFLSIHLNKFTSTKASGAQVFYAPDFEEAKELGACIQKSLKDLIQNDNNRVIKKGTKSTYLLYNAKIPAVIIECGFISNLNELKMLKNEEYQSKLAFAIFCGTENYFSETKGR